MDDSELLRAYVTSRDQRAFAALAARYVDLVYAAARRQCGGDAHLAEDVTQAVFVILARKAGRVRPDMLAGWLITSARLAAKTARRGEVRRAQRERKAAIMHPRSNPNPHPSPHDPADRSTASARARAGAGASAAAVDVDAALASLGEADRTAVTLRFLHGRSQAEVAAMMGISQAAAAKRVSRAVAKLRDFMEGRGHDVGAAGATAPMIDLLAREAAVTAPPHLAAEAAAAGAASAGAASAGAPGAASAAARAIAESALAMARLKLIATTTAGAVLAAGIVLLLLLTTPRSTAPAPVSAPAAWTPLAGAAPSVWPQPPAVPIKVGYYISHFTATGPSWTMKPQGYGGQTRGLRDLRGAADLALRPLIEPDSATDEVLRGQLRKNFAAAAATQPIDVTSADALRKLDVIMCNFIANVPAPALDAIEAAVKDGAGLYVRTSLGTTSPTLTPQVKRLLLLDEARFGMSAQDVPCEVVGTGHPLLGRLTAGQVIMARPNGPHGILAAGAVPLLRVRSMADITSLGGAASQGDGYVHYPLYAGQYGKGRIVVCAFATFSPTPPDLQEATDGQFVPGCIRWLARREPR